MAISLGAISLGTIGLGGCDEARYRAEVGSSPPTDMHERSLRSVINARGLEALYRIEHPQGVALEAAEASVDAFGFEMTLGPVSERLTVERWTVTPGGEWLDVGFAARDVSVVIAARVGEGSQAQICRYAVDVDEVEATDAVSISEDDGKPTVVPTDEPDVVLHNPIVTRIGSCQPLDDLGDDAAVEQLFVDYLYTALTRSAREAMQLSPIDSLGLIYGGAALERVSSYENRRGELQIATQINEDDGARMSARALHIDLDLALSGQRASCAPPLGATPPDPSAAHPIAASVLESSGADLGLSIASSALIRLAQSSALSGFACRGLESATLDGGGSNLAADQVFFDQIGLDHLPLGPWVEPVLSPGGLPRLQTGSDHVLTMHWPDLSIDFYADIQGVPTRIAQLTTSVDLRLRPIARTTHIDLAIDAVSISDASIQSQWLAEPPTDTDLVRWSERVLLMVLEDALTLPLPLEPGAPLHLSDAQIRNDDVLLLFELDARP
ncbi:MAG: hypothetical protein ACOC9W_06210 [Persicimonas sp.]